MTLPGPPVPRRITRPKWWNVRVVGGVLLLVASIAVGTRVIGAASQTNPVWAVAHDLAPGTVLTGDDLVVREVNLGEGVGLYLDSAASVAGLVLGRAVTAGELLPAAAVAELGDSRVLAVSVGGDHIAPGIGHGSVVDLYLVSGRADAPGGGVETRLLRGSVTVQSVLAPATGGLSGAVSSRYQVSLLLSPDDADGLVRELPLGDPVLVLHSGSVVDVLSHTEGE